MDQAKLVVVKKNKRQRRRQQQEIGERERERERKVWRENCLHLGLYLFVRLNEDVEIVFLVLRAADVLTGSLMRLKETRKWSFRGEAVWAALILYFVLWMN